MDSDSLSNAQHLGPTASAVIVFVLIPTFFTWQYWALRWSARRERDLVKAPRVLPAGRACAHGRVVPVEGAAAPVVLTIHETHAAQTKRGRGNASWRETRRELTAQTFDVREADGRVVRVEPGPDPDIDLWPHPRAAT